MKADGLAQHLTDALDARTLHWFNKLFDAHSTMHFLHPGTSNKTVMRIFHKKKQEDHKNYKTEALNPNSFWGHPDV